MTMPRVTTEFIWTGDPEDELWCKVGDLSAHCECMSDEWWFASVSLGGNYLLHTSLDDLLPKTASAAKRLCEMVMRLAIMEYLR